VSNLFEKFLPLMRTAMKEIRILIKQRKSDTVLVKKNDGDLTRNIDKIVENIFINYLIRYKIPVKVISEETGILNITSNPQFAMFLDPVDGSDIAARGYPLCSIALSLYCLETKKPLFSIIGDIIQGKIFYTNEKNAFIIEDEMIKPMKASDYKPLNECMLVCYAAKPDRIMKIFEQKKLFEQIGLFLNYGGPMDIARVGEGTVDIFLEFQKGFKCIDYVAGIDITQKSGAIITDLQGYELEPDFDLDGRKKFLVTSNRKLHEQILQLINNGEYIL